MESQFILENITYMQGKTIIATDVDGTSEIVRNNFNGILIQSKNSDDIAKAIIKLYKDDKLKCRLEKEALQTYLNKFTYDKFINKYKKNYYT